MMLLLIRALLLTVTIGVIQAQLVTQPFVNIKQLTDEQKAGAFDSEGGEVRKGLSSPRICDPHVQQHSGYLQVARGTKYFFWLFESRHSPRHDPLILWLNGGPGCSSQLGLLTENGPCTVQKDGNTTLNPHGWNSRANAIWIDQPAGTGFSTGRSSANNEHLVERNMYSFFKKFYEILPQYASLDLYMFGESYAGHYIPVIASYFVHQAEHGGFKVPLKGIALGNSQTVPEEQFKWYPEMAFDGGSSRGGSLDKGVVDESVYKSMQSANDGCIPGIHACNTIKSSFVCSSAYVACNEGELAPYQDTGMNPYDMRLKCDPGHRLCYDFDMVVEFLNSPDIQAQIGVNKTWEKCNDEVNSVFTFSPDWLKRYDTKVADLLASGMQVLIYAGDTDYICNWLGNKAWVLGMDWPYKENFTAAEDLPYMLNGVAKGRLRSFQGLHFMQIYEAGHMAPTDQPEVVLQMVNEFVRGKLASRKIAALRVPTNSTSFLVAFVGALLIVLAMVLIAASLTGRKQDKVSNYEVLRG